ncbi:MAG: stage V sporulation protein AA [Lachnospiraceae bacterium]
MSNIMVYLKGEQSVALRDEKVKLKDIATIYCRDLEIKHNLEKLEILEFPKKKDNKQVISVLKLIELMKKEYRDIEVQNIGESDIIVFYHCPKPQNKYWQYAKIMSICVIVFFGAAITIMAYNNDVDIDKLFSNLYFLFTGIKTEEPTVIHLFYSIGLTVGVLVFFNHIMRKRLTDDPTPFEVQMRLYERDVNDTFIIGAGRKEKEKDVDE